MWELIDVGVQLIRCPAIIDVGVELIRCPAMIDLGVQLSANGAVQLIGNGTGDTDLCSGSDAQTLTTDRKKQRAGHVRPAPCSDSAPMMACPLRPVAVVRARSLLSHHGCPLDLLTCPS